MLDFGDGANAADAYSAALFYIIVYAVMSVGAFGVLLYLSRAGFECENLEDMRGLNRRSPWWAFVMLIIMFSLTGIPPTAGFYAKLAVLSAAVSAGHVWLAVAAVMFSLVGAFYYLRVIVFLFMKEPEPGAPVAWSRVTGGVLGSRGKGKRVMRGDPRAGFVSWATSSFGVAYVSLLTPVVVIGAHLGFSEAARDAYDLEPVSRYLSVAEKQGRPIAFVGDYHGQFHFLGRLRRPILEIPGGSESLWIRQNPRGKVIQDLQYMPADVDRAEFTQPYRDDVLAVWGREGIPGG